MQPCTSRALEGADQQHDALAELLLQGYEILLVTVAKQCSDRLTMQICYRIDDPVALYSAFLQLKEFVDQRLVLVNLAGIQ